jgi:hypothetical protein
MKLKKLSCLRWSVLSGLLICGLFALPCRGQETKAFAQKGTVELGGNVSFQSVTPVFNGASGDASTVFTLAPFFGYFVSDGFELGVNPFDITVNSLPNSNSSTRVSILFAPSYNFKTNSIAYPFVEALLGYTSLSNRGTESGFSWGGRGGLKLAVADRGLLNLGVQYLQITMNPSGAIRRYGSNDFSLAAGFTIWM